MRIYSVLPIAKGLGKETLTYFGRDGIPLGALVTIPLRKRNIPAIVVEESDASSARAKIRSSRFALKKISSVESGQFLPAAFLSAAQGVAQYFAASTGAILSHLIPQIILKKVRDFAPKQSTDSPAYSGEKFVIQADDEERFAHYRSFIREEFAKRSSVFFCVPTREDIIHARETLNKGIEQYTCAFHGDLGARELKVMLSILKTKDHPVLIVGTVPFLSLAREDVGTIILERENSRGYRTIARPLFDLRKFAEEYARGRKVKYVVGDTILSLETFWRFKNDEFIEFSPLKVRLVSTARVEVVDMKTRAGEKNKEFRVLSPALESLVARTKEEKANLFIFAARKGIAPITVCGDCGTLLSCRQCGAPLVLHRASRAQTIYICHKCGVERSSLEKCANCGSWKLVPLGIGIERVEEVIKKRFPDLHLLRLDKDIAPGAKKVKEILEKFLASPGSVLLGTELALLSLHESLPYAAVASVDSLLSIPDFRMNERVFLILLKIRSLAESHFLIQTRGAENPIFKTAADGNLSEFYRTEIEDRKKFNYPPFFTFIKISLTGRESAVRKGMAELKRMFTGQEVSIFTGLHGGIERYFIMHALIRLPRERWPDERLAALLKALPPQYLVQVDPESLL
ncbi:hypothetical protein EPN83_02430 [Patescibacteria group bacterium]|nr:MAG: hypothetical protein EPN83_02430 [Patescibacteria group bacterium]